VSKSANNPERDRQTLDQLVQGQQEGLQNLISDHGPYVRAYVKRKLGQLLDHWQVEETMSLASLRAWQSASRFDPTRGRLRTWFAVIARNCGLSLIAQHQGQPFVSIDGVDPSILGVASGKPEGKRMQLVVDVHRAIGLLPQLQRSVLLADLNAGTTLPAPLLAERFRTTAQSVYVARHRGRRDLRVQLERLGYGDRQRASHTPSSQSQLPSASKL
jgi:DNA-directed RNA polymerase specialized sigma24 family protein